MDFGRRLAGSNPAGFLLYGRELLLALRGWNSWSVETNAPSIRRQLGRIRLQFADNSINYVWVTNPDFCAFLAFAPYRCGSALLWDFKLNISLGAIMLGTQ